MALKRKSVLFGLVIIVAGGGYFVYKTISANGTPVRYVTAAAEKGTLVVSVSGSGQVSTSNQIDIKPKVSGDVISLPIKSGQEVRAGAVLATLRSEKTSRPAALQTLMAASRPKVSKSVRRDKD